MFICFVSLYLFIQLFLFSFLFFKQKTAYEMRISDWSSDVCSSDLIVGEVVLDTCGEVEAHGLGLDHQLRLAAEELHVAFAAQVLEIGRASCRERVCQYV